MLSDLQRGEFIYEQPAFPDAEYTFKHALTQEVAYNAVLSERRKELHERAAQAIEEIFHSRLNEYCSELAYHYNRSGNRHNAVKDLYRAGQQALQRFAYAEAITQLTTALEMLKTLPDTPERVQQELTLHIALGASLGATKGWATPELESVYTRARQLCQQAGKTPQLFPVLWGLWAFYSVRAELETSYDLAHQLLNMAQSVNDPAMPIVAHYALGNDLFCLGEFSRARDHLEQSLVLYDREHHGSLAFLMGGEELGVVCRAVLAGTLWVLGYPAQTLQRVHEALTLAQELGSPFNLAFALGVRRHKSSMARRAKINPRASRRSHYACGRAGIFILFLGSGSVLKGWAVVEQGQVEEGIAETARAWLHCSPLGRTGTGRITLPCWQARMERPDKLKKGSQRLARH